MGKRSDFKRIARDAYDTPFEAVKPLLPHLKPATRFIEPCVGNGCLAGHLKRAAHIPVGTYDLPDDARSKHYDVEAVAMFVTNPRYWGRPDNLHPLIANLSDQAPTWLLMSGDWLFNLSSTPLMSRLRKIVAVGRVRWIPDSPFTGKDNTAWLLFSYPDDEHEPRFLGP